MFGKKKDRGETRTYQYKELLKVRPSGKLHGAGDSEAEEQICLALAQAFSSLAEELEHQAQECRRQSKTIIEAEAFGAMISGS